MPDHLTVKKKKKMRNPIDRGTPPPSTKESEILKAKRKKSAKKKLKRIFK